MTCTYCGTRNWEGEHRCYRCGRRFAEFGERPLWAGALSAAEDNGGVLTAVAPPIVVANAAAHDNGFATSRFMGTTLVQRAVQAGTDAADTDHYTPALATRVSQRRSLEAAVDCDLPAAVPMHRVVATALDLGLMVAGIGLFLGVLTFLHVPVVLNAGTTPCYVAVLGLLALLYEALWAVAGTDSFGARVTRLRLVTLHGDKPTVRERAVRLGSRVVSTMAGGLGLLWALCDEEGLCWHDHMSGTFYSVDRHR